MNIIYLLTNTSKTIGKRFYIGLKLKLDPRTVQKYFDYYVKKRLDINDI